MGQKYRYSSMDKDSIRTRLLVIFLIGIVSLTVILSVIGYRVFRGTLLLEIGNNRVDVLRQIGERVRQIKNNAYTLSNLYYYDKHLQELLENDSGSEGTSGLVQYMEQLTYQYKSSFHEEGRRFQVVLSLEDGGGYSSEEIPDDYDFMNPKTKIWFKGMSSAQGESVDIASYKKTDGDSCFSVARCMYGSGRGDTPAGYLMINIEESLIHEMYSSLTAGNDNSIYVVDEKGVIISSSNRKLNGFQFFHMKNLDTLFGDKAYTITKMRGEDILFTRYYDRDSRCTILEEIPLEVLMEPIYRVRFIILCIALTVMGMAVLLAGCFADWTAKPIMRLCDFMLQVTEENMEKRCEVQGYTEIKILSAHLNSMLQRMQELMVGIKQKEQQKRKLELGFLQAQINPHFMYNTLFSIKCMVDMEHNGEASRMLASFIQLLQCTLSNPDEYITIQQEFYILQQYVEIQKSRYADSFETVFEYSEKVGDKKIPKLLIQPLLENAIFHGVESKSGDGMIIITAIAKGENLEIVVEDNGLGISEDIIEKIERGEQIGGKTHVGIVNVKERIQLNFGGNYGMRIVSNPDEGTSVTLTLPMLD